LTGAKKKMCKPVGINVRPLKKDHYPQGLVLGFVSFVFWGVFVCWVEVVVVGSLFFFLVVFFLGLGVWGSCFFIGVILDWGPF